MKEDFLGEFLGNQNRARTVRVFVFGQSEVFTRAQLSKRAGVSPNAAAREIKVLEGMGIIKKAKVSIKLANAAKRTIAHKQQEPTWALDQDFKHLRALSSFVHEVSPVRHAAILDALKHSGKLSAVILSGSFMGDSTRPADLIIAADGLNEGRLESAIKVLEPSLGREIRYASFTTPEFRYRLTVQDRLLRETLDFPHLVLLDRLHVL